jgi:hypothetical protein
MREQCNLDFSTESCLVGRWIGCGCVCCGEHCDEILISNYACHTMKPLYSCFGHSHAALKAKNDLRFRDTEPCTFSTDRVSDERAAHTREKLLMLYLSLMPFTSLLQFLELECS